MQPSIRTVFFAAACAASAVILSACGGGAGSLRLTPSADARQALSGPAKLAAVPSAPPYARGHTNAVPTAPASGVSRTGQIYSIYITAPTTGDTVAFTVFEPSTIVGGQTYPLVLHGHAWDGTRTRTLGSPAANPSAGISAGDNIAELVDNGFGVISFDQRGFGETTGTADGMNPDTDGADILAILDWAQATLPWLTYAPTLDGSDPHEPVVGAIGGSYGGMYQYMLVNIDPRHRLRAIVPNIAPANQNEALVPGGAFKSVWNDVLYGGYGVPVPAHLDPFLATTYYADDDIANNAESSLATSTFDYRSASYFCSDTPVASNDGLTPTYAAASAPPKINAMIWNGVRDPLFNLTQGYENYLCMHRGGGDVRLLSYQAGHNSSGAVPDPGAKQFLPANDSSDTRCGASLSEDAAQLMWFNRYLKNETSAASGIPAQVCVSLAAGSAALLTAVPANVSYDVGTMTTTAGANVDQPTAAAVYTAPSGGAFEVGIPHVTVTVASAGAASGTPIVYVGIGQMHASTPGVWDLVDNQVTPLRGIGSFSVDLAAGGTRLAAGDQLGLLVYGLHDQYAPVSGTNAVQPAVVPVTVSGNVLLPIVSTLPTI